MTEPEIRRMMDAAYNRGFAAGVKMEAERWLAVSLAKEAYERAEARKQRRKA